MRTLEQALRSQGGVGRGFDSVRIGLSLAIFGLHALTVTNTYYPLDETPVWMIHFVLVPMFFALSGFLVSASAGRLGLRDFLENRALRIAPALAVDTLFCALIVGPAFTQLSLGRYFADPAFGRFLFNMVGWVHFTLPGVFETHPFPRVNGALWTVPFELTCYASVAVMIVLGILRRRFWIMALVCLYFSMSVLLGELDLHRLLHARLLESVISTGFVDHESQAIAAFLVGVLCFQYRTVIPYSRTLFGLSLLCCIAVAFGLRQSQGEVPAMRFVLMPAIVYMTVFLGLTRLPLPGFFRKGDYSYGIYLYHQPLQQVVIGLFPALALAPGYGGGFVAIAALPLVLIMSKLSWHLVEKPSLALRRRQSLALVNRLREAAVPATVRLTQPERSVAETIRL